MNWKCPICGNGWHKSSSGESPGNCPGEVIFLKKCIAALCKETGEDVVFKPEDIPCQGCASKSNAILEGKEKIREVMQGLEQKQGGDGDLSREVKILIKTMECVNDDLHWMKLKLRNREGSSRTTIKLTKLIRKGKKEEAKVNLEEAERNLEVVKRSTLSILSSELGSTFEGSEVFHTQNSSTEERTIEQVIDKAIVTENVRDTCRGPGYDQVTNEAELDKLTQFETSSVAAMDSTISQMEEESDTGNDLDNEIRIVNTFQVSLETSPLTEVGAESSQSNFVSTSPVPSTSKAAFFGMICQSGLNNTENGAILSMTTPVKGLKNKRPRTDGQQEDNFSNVPEPSNKKTRSESADQTNVDDLLFPGRTSQPVFSESLTSENNLSLNDRIDDLHTAFRELPAILLSSPQHFHELLLTLKNKNKLDLFKTGCPVDNTTLLHLAVRNVEIAEESLWILADAGLDFNEIDSNDDDKGTPLYYAVKQQRPAKFWKRLIELGAEPHKVNEYGGSLLHAAAQFGCDDLGILDELFNKYKLKANPMSLPGYGGKSPLHIAVNNRREEMIKFLIKHKARVNALDNESNAPIHLTGWGFGNSLMFLKNLNIFKELVKGKADMRLKNKAGRIGLHSFLKNQDDRKMKFTVEDFKKLVHYLEGKKLHCLFKIPDNDGVIPLALAVEKSKIDIEYLKSISNKIKMNLTGHLSQFLHYAIRGTRNNEFLEGLVQLGANIKTTNPSGATLLHIAASYSASVDPFKFLLGKGLSIKALDNEGNSVLSEAIKANQSSEIVNSLLRSSNDAGLKYVDKSKTTLLQVASEYGTIQVMKSILESGMKNENEFNINEKNDKDETAFHFAMRALIDPVDKAKLHLEHGALSDTVTKEKWIALHYAVAHGTPAAVEYCLNELKQNPISSQLYQVAPLFLIAKSDEINEETLEKAKLLVMKGAEINESEAVTLAESVAMETLLHFNDSKISFLKLLLDNKVDVNGYSYRYNDYLDKSGDGTLCGLGHTLVQCVVFTLKSWDFKKVADLLMEYNADFAKRTEFKSKNVFHLASVSGNLAALGYFLKKNVPGLNTADEFGLTPLLNLIKFCNEKVHSENEWKCLEKSMIWLLQHGAVADAASEALFAEYLQIFKDKFGEYFDTQLKLLLWTDD